MVHTNYHGPLRRGEYQFAFGGSVIDPNGGSGFLVPQSGRIKKIKGKIKVGKDNCGISENRCILFTILATNNLEIRDLERLSTWLITASDGYDDPAVHVFDLRPEHNTFNILVSEGDIMNIRSDCNNEDAKNCTYLVIILLELDPL